MLTDVQTHLDAIKVALAPYLLSLTPEERKTMLRMADKTLAFVQKTTEYAIDNPAFVPSFVDLAELKQNAIGMAVLTPPTPTVRTGRPRHRFHGDDAGSESYSNSLTIYTNIKFLAKNKQPGAQAAFDDLKARFAGQSTPNKEKAKA